MKLRACVLLLASACGDDAADSASTKVEVPDDWQELQSSCGRLGFAAPQDFGTGLMPSNDGCVEGLSFASCAGSLEWGTSSDRLEGIETEDEFKGSRERIDGYSALLVTWRCRTLYCSAVNLPTDQDVSMTMFFECGSLRDREKTTTIMRSLHVID